ncbi:MAG TPA: RNA polymerase sporulation sigma factor SigE, partial [Clostridiales bacterium]|nr:RNA polymerase sporulation sigma factor SigE [Clostridiales bacterium]
MLDFLECLKEKIVNMYFGANDLLYIGGQDILPPPLTKKEEETLILNISE